MRKFAEIWPDKKIVQRTVAQIPWRSNIALTDKLKTADLRLWYAQKTIENGWSRDILVTQINTRLHERAGNATHNFETALLPADSDMASQIFKDPYVFDFLGTDELRRESELEQRLMDHLEKFLIELGQGFAFVGRQVHMEVGEDDCYIDLLRHPDDKKTIGLLLVKAGWPVQVWAGKNSKLQQYLKKKWKNGCHLQDADINAETVFFTYKRKRTWKVGLQAYRDQTFTGRSGVAAAMQKPKTKRLISQTTRPHFPLTYPSVTDAGNILKKIPPELWGAFLLRLYSLPYP